MDIRVGSVDKPITMNVPVSGSARTIEGGLETVVSKQATNKKRRGYFIYGKLCVVCGAKTNHDHDQADVSIKDRCQCGSRSFRVLDRMSPNEVEDIINAKTQYKCNECDRMYDVPTPCCIKNYQSEPSKDLKPGWYCTHCARIYDKKPTMCCNAGELIAGHHYPATRSEYHAKPKILIPI